MKRREAICKYCGQVIYHDTDHDSLGDHWWFHAVSGINECTTYATPADTEER